MQNVIVMQLILIGKKLFKINILWKTMPGRVKQVPQDSTE